MWDQVDWQALDRMRALFLQGTAGEADYWQSASDLRSYDLTFAQRIGWKWDFVLNDLKSLGWAPPSGDILDWGCGSGIASRAFLDAFAPTENTLLRVWDRSTLAMNYAVERARKKYPNLNVADDPQPNKPPAVLLISHVLTELSPDGLDSLLSLAQTATAVVWVEPGTYETSRALIKVRERLKDQFKVVAPCVHQSACGMQSPENSRHWCHFFAEPPPEVFTDGDWTRFGILAGVDLRSLPLSYLVLGTRAPALDVEGAFRMIGRPRIFKPDAQILGCDGDGVRECRLLKRTAPAEYKALKKGNLPTRMHWVCEKNQIQKLY